MKLNTYLLIFICVFSLGICSSQNNKTTILWDASYSMFDKDLQKELDVLQGFIANDSLEDIRLVVYANTIQADTIFKPNTETFNVLKAYLISINYDGSSNLPPKLIVNKSHTLLHFTDVITTQPLTNNHYILSSKANTYSYKVPTTNPFYVNISTIDSSQIVQLIQGKTPKDEFLSTYKTEYAVNSTTTSSFTISGKVFDNYGNLAGVKVANLTNQETTTTNANGEYKILANQNDFIQYETEDISKTIKITAATNITINFPLVGFKNSLDEVVIEDTSKVNEDDSKVLGNTVEETKSLGYAVVKVGSEQALSIQKNAGEFIQGRVPGLKFNSKSNLNDVIIRGYSSFGGNTSNNAMVFIDGIQTRTDTGSRQLDIIPPDQIEDIKVLKGLAATAIYGPNARNGVILITTKTPKFDNPKTKASKRKNFYKKTLKVDNKNETYDSLSKTLSKADSVDEAYSLYLKERFIQEDNLDFYFAAYDYFLNKKAYNKASTILSNIEELYGLNQKEQLALAYKLETKNKNLDALSIYKTLDNLSSSNQLIRNKAALQYNLKQLKESVQNYLQLINNDRISEDLKEVLVSEIRHIYTKHPEAFKGLNIQTLLKQRILIDGRVVFEWNDPNANFQLQFVNPNKLFYTWSHLQDEDFEKISKERETSSSIKEFLLVGAEKGDWFFNILKPEHVKNPENCFIKMTLYKKYGTPQEYKEVRLIPLNFNDPLKTVARIYVK